MGTTLRSMEDVLAGGGSNTLVLIGQVCVAIGVSLMVNERMKREVHIACEREAQLLNTSDKSAFSSSYPNIATLASRYQQVIR